MERQEKRNCVGVEKWNISLEFDRGEGKKLIGKQIIKIGKCALLM